MVYERLLDAKAIIGEGPVWDDQIQRLYWVDIKGCRIHRYDPVSGQNETFQLNKMVGAVALRRDGTLIAALHDGFATVNFDKQTVETIWDAKLEPNHRFNDGKCDPDGRFWAGTMHVEKPQKTASLYCLVPGGSVHRVLDGIAISNGMDWSADKQYFYYIDSPTREIWRFRYNPENADLSEKQVVVRIGEHEGIPDGMTLDTEGLIWVAQWGGSRVCCYDPKTGKKKEEILFPVEQVSCCVFGGRNLDELYVTTAWNTLSPEARQKQPEAGALYRVKTSAQGRPPYRFGA